MSLLNICARAGLVLSLLQQSYQSCTEGTARQCSEADVAPGTNMAGEGFDITKMERKGSFVLDMSKWKRKDKTCTLCTNPYLGKKKQKLPLSVVNWRATQSCSMKVATSLHQSTESLVSSITSSVNNNWSVNLDFKHASLMLAGTHSKLAEHSMEKSKKDRFSFVSQSFTCKFYSYAVTRNSALHGEFRKALKELPKTYSPENKQRYYNLIDNFGTHYITKVKMGGSVRSVTSIRQCQASLSGISLQEAEMCLEVEASASFKVDLKAKSQHCQKDIDKTESKASFSSIFNDRFTETKGGYTQDPDLLFSSEKNPSAYKDWLNTLPQNPDIVSYSLNSLHELLPADNPVRKNLRSAISHYILQKGLWKNCSGSCQAGIKRDARDSCVCQCHNDPAVNADCCPTRKGMARVIITVQRASGLWGDHTTATDGYVKVFFNGIMVQRSPVLPNDDNPRWDTVVDLGSQDVSSGKAVRFEVWDEDSKWDDDLLGACDQVLQAGVKEDVCNLQHGQLFYKFDVQCAPSLGGDRCADYVASPMTRSLESTYVSRHARPIPKAMLREMGVFVDGASSLTNHSLAAETSKLGEMQHAPPQH
ncbi:perforin-1-like isoform 2-T4 [Spinachia spinachia]